MVSEAQYFLGKGIPLEQQLQRIHQKETWTALNPELKISETPFGPPAQGFAFERDDTLRAVAQVSLEGYLMSRPGLIPKALCQALARAVERLQREGFHPLYAAVYDEYWQVLQGIQPYLEGILGPGCYPVGDFWTWLISPQTANAGWAPHRDLQFKTPTLREDGRPTIVTVWLPFSDATPLNGCMYLVPQNLDPNLPEHPERYGLSMQNIRALPASAGTVLAWNQYVFHWGSRCSSFADGPRISTGIYYQSADVEPFVGKRVRFDGPLSFETRIAYIASNILNYHQYHDYPEEILSMCFRHIRGLENYEQLVPSDLYSKMPLE